MDNPNYNFSEVTGKVENTVNDTVNAIADIEKCVQDYKDDFVTLKGLYRALHDIVKPGPSV